MPLPALRVSVLASSLVALLVTVAATGCGPYVPPEPVVCGIDRYDDGPGNDTEETAFDLGELRDDPDSGVGISGEAGTNDVDWYRIHVRDTGLGGDPNIRVTVSDGFNVSSWFVCDGGRSASTSCLEGGSEYDDLQGARGCRAEQIGSIYDETGAYVDYSSDRTSYATTDCSGTSDDDGTLYIRVESASSYGVCGYGLSIDVD